MAKKIGLISDPHACAAPVREALTLFKKNNVDHIFCLGDIAGYGEELSETVNLLKNAGCDCIMGNHESWYLDKHTGSMDQNAAYFQCLPTNMELVTEEKKIYLVHASPPDDDMNGIRLLNEKGKIIESEKKQWSSILENYDFDILVVGHTHQVFYEKIGNKLVINPGSTKFNHSCMILVLPEMKVEIISLSGKKPILSWNWSMMHNKN